MKNFSIFLIVFFTIILFTSNNFPVYNIKGDFATDSLFNVFEVTEGLFDFDNPYTLGLEFIKETETFSIYSPTKENDNKYNHGVVLFPFKEYLYAQWQTSKKDEDAKETHVLYSRSKNGKTWSSPEVLVPISNNGIYTSGGWWSFNDTLIAFINFWPNNIKPKGGYVQYILSPDGINWSEKRRLLDIENKYLNGIFEQDPHLLPNGSILSALHEQPGLKLSPYYTKDKSGLSGWTKGDMQNLKFDEISSREIEPSSFYRSDNSIVMVFRDQAGSFKQLASVSRDFGETWSIPVITNMPDSRSKQSAGNLTDGTAYLVNNPSGSKTRYPLVITLSDNGFIFDKAYLLRSGGENLQKMKYDGKFKREGYSYPKSIIWNNYLYIGYATNKEDIELTRIPINFLK